MNDFDPSLDEIVSAYVDGEATADEASLFRELWQERVRRLLLEHADDPEVIEVRA